MDARKQNEILAEAEKTCNERFPQIQYCLSFDMDPKYEKPCIKLSEQYEKCFEEVQKELKEKRNFYRIN
ncbi:hypothetical protein TTHERM_001298459 (macronuclear) [Tetrahymena thermophila SB210]|uniref:Uncharacterized protein n=1 Tax=Tetrahymena thermophila (strain SB210) TaxID=312017 RepID=W7X1E7_TETTS|nr:hypothetical protein TTHERM_001298459 [Tetrahymena thermophila SB210]EWS71422.1 hypothetical protein TTHERM_001298459 [Tetrahymena thermophila SB210]|eukprot:XP_012656042.1 hypothetical protein TTHERM_001298459 [Tetrahymena thermophila SB210]